MVKWSKEKNKLLKSSRGISFEDVIVAMYDGRVLDDLIHPKEKYNNQRIMIVNINDYAYVVPYIEEEDGIFLKTIYPDRNYTKLYLFN